MKLYISGICFAIATFLACVPWGYPWNIPAQFAGCILMMSYYWDSDDWKAQTLANLPTIIINIIGVVLLWLR